MFVFLLVLILVHVCCALNKRLHTLQPIHDKMLDWTMDAVEIIKIMSDQSKQIQENQWQLDWIMIILEELQAGLIQKI